MKGWGFQYYFLKSRLKNAADRLSWPIYGKKQVHDARGARILVYHGVCSSRPFRYNTLFVTINSFRKQLDLFRKYCHFLSLDQYYAGEFHPDKFNLCLSFDDGFANNFCYVLPLLEEYQVPACFFITAVREKGQDILWNECLSIAYEQGPAMIGIGGHRFLKGKGGKYFSKDGGSLFDHLRKSGFEEKQRMMELLGPLRFRAPEQYWVQLSESQIREMSASKWVTIGSHGYYHNDLATLSHDELRFELTASKKYHEGLTGKEIKALAFPYGSYHPDTVRQAKEAGYTQLLGTELIQDVNHGDTTLRGRLTINPFVNAGTQLLNCLRRESRQRW